MAEVIGISVEEGLRLPHKPCCQCSSYPTTLGHCSSLECGGSSARPSASVVTVVQRHRANGQAIKGVICELARYLNRCQHHALLVLWLWYIRLSTFRTKSHLVSHLHRIRRCCRFSTCCATLTLVDSGAIPSNQQTTFSLRRISDDKIQEPQGLLTAHSNFQNLHKKAYVIPVKIVALRPVRGRLFSLHGRR
jgi:hypothetical protein